MQVRAVISGRSCVKLNALGGAVAQLGARLDGIEEVVGSNPIGSTKVLANKRVTRSLLYRLEHLYRLTAVQAFPSRLRESPTPDGCRFSA
jgi:hypothetical protein